MFWEWIGSKALSLICTAIVWFRNWGHLLVRNPIWWKPPLALSGLTWSTRSARGSGEWWWLQWFDHLMIIGDGWSWGAQHWDVVQVPKKEEGEDEDGEPREESVEDDLSHPRSLCHLLDALPYPCYHQVGDRSYWHVNIPIVNIVDSVNIVNIPIGCLVQRPPPTLWRKPWKGSSKKAERAI